MPDASKRIARAVLVSAAIALAVNLLRLYGELQTWDPFWFNREGGGGGSPLGISWLVLPFSFWFGRKLAQDGHRPASTSRGLLFPLIGVLLMVGIFVGSFNLLADWRHRALASNIGASCCGLLAFAGWKRAYFVNLAAGLLARIPVVVIQLVALDRAWDVHFAKGPPGAPAQDIPFMLTLAQAMMWPFGYTVLVGGFFTALGAMTVRR
jgi:hypothetical protein